MGMGSLITTERSETKKAICLIIHEINPPFWFRDGVRQKG